MPILLLALLGCSAQAPVPTSLKPGDPHVLVVILDGVRVEEITSTWTSDLTGMTGEAHAPHIWSDVAPDATVVRDILNTVLTSTAPGHATLVTGRAEPLFTVGFGDEGPALYRPQIPTIFEEARDQMGWNEADTVLMADSVVMAGVTQSVYPGLEGLGGTWMELTDPLTGGVEEDDTRTFTVLQQLIATNPPPLLVANMHDADRLGHEGIDGGYVNRVEEQDAQLAQLWNWLKTQPDYMDGLLMIVTADHGRHRHDMDGGWTNHGDSCAGCREVPLFLLGDGVEKNVVTDGSYALVDIAPTVAAHLGVELPWAQGLPLSPLSESAAVAVRSGDVDVAVSGGHVATRTWRDDFEARSEVRVDGVAVSTPGIFAAEAPAILAGDGRTYTCFRELSTVEDDEGFLPWTPRCLVDDGTGWTDIGFPEDAVGPFWTPTLEEKDGRLWVAWLHTPRTRGADGSDGVRLASWSPTLGWSEPDGPGSYFTTTDVTMAATSHGFLLAGALNLSDPEEPYTRRTAVWGFGPGGRDLGDEKEFQLEELLDEPRRVERPAIQADGQHVQLAMIALEEDRRFIGYVESNDGGATWSAPVALPSEGEAFVHMPPRWDGEWVVWGARLDDGTAGLCRVKPGDAAAACVSTGAERLDSFAVEGGVGTVSVDVGVGQWEVGEVTW